MFADVSLSQAASQLVFLKVDFLQLPARHHHSMQIKAVYLCYVDIFTRLSDICVNGTRPIPSQGEVGLEVFRTVFPVSYNLFGRTLLENLVSWLEA